MITLYFLRIYGLFFFVPSIYVVNCINTGKARNRQASRRHVLASSRSFTEPSTTLFTSPLQFGAVSSQSCRRVTREGRHQRCVSAAKGCNQVSSLEFLGALAFLAQQVTGRPAEITSVSCTTVLQTHFCRGPQSPDLAHHTAYLRASNICLILRNSHSRQNTNNRHNDHQFNQSKTLLTFVHLNLLHVINLKSCHFSFIQLRGGGALPRFRAERGVT